MWNNNNLAIFFKIYGTNLLLSQVQSYRVLILQLSFGYFVSLPHLIMCTYLHDFKGNIFNNQNIFGDYSELSPMKVQNMMIFNFL